MSDLTLRIDARRIETDPAITVYEVELIDEQRGIWPETFGSVHDLAIFLRGVKAMCALAGGHMPEPEIPEPGHGTTVTFR